VVEKLKARGGMRSFGFLVFTLVTMTNWASVEAFNAGGHMVVGLIAHDALSARDRSEVVRILRQPS
jgi:hypothetical protein